MPEFKRDRVVFVEPQTREQLARKLAQLAEETPTYTPPTIDPQDPYVPPGTTYPPGGGGDGGGDIVFPPIDPVDGFNPIPELPPEYVPIDEWNVQIPANAWTIGDLRNLGFWENTLVAFYRYKTGAGANNALEDRNFTLFVNLADPTQRQAFTSIGSNLEQTFGGPGAGRRLLIVNGELWLVSVDLFRWTGTGWGNAPILSLRTPFQGSDAYNWYHDGSYFFLDYSSTIDGYTVPRFLQIDTSNGTTAYHEFASLNPGQDVVQQVVIANNYAWVDIFRPNPGRVETYWTLLSTFSWSLLRSTRTDGSMLPVYPIGPYVGVGNNGARQFLMWEPQEDSYDEWWPIAFDRPDGVLVEAAQTFNGWDSDSGAEFIQIGPNVYRTDGIPVPGKPGFIMNVQVYGPGGGLRFGALLYVEAYELMGDVTTEVTELWRGTATPLNVYWDQGNEGKVLLFQTTDLVFRAVAIP